MSDFDDLDEVFGALRGPATPGELANEAETVELMANAHLASKGSSMNSVSRRTRVATLIAAGVIGFGGVAAAGPGGFDIAELDGIEEVTEAAGDTTETTIEEETTETTVEEETTETTVEEETTETTIEDEVTETTVEETEGEPELRTAIEPTDVEGDEPEDPNPDTAFNEAYCLEGNHGKTVSAVARGLPPFDEMDVEVRDAAQSSCGKDVGEIDEDEIEIEDVDEDDKVVAEFDVEDERGKPAHAGPPAHAGGKKSSSDSGEGGKSNGNGKGKGKGGK